MFRVIKDSENVDERQHCFLLQTAGHESRYLSVETRQELLRIEAAWHCAVCSAVIKLKVQKNHNLFSESCKNKMIVFSARHSMWCGKESLQC